MFSSVTVTDLTSFTNININIWGCESKRSEAGTDWPSASFIIHQTGSLWHTLCYSPRVHGRPAFIRVVSDFRCQSISPPAAGPGNTKPYCQIYWFIWVSCRDDEIPNLSAMMLCKSERFIVPVWSPYLISLMYRCQCISSLSLHLMRKWDNTQSAKLMCVCAKPAVCQLVVRQSSW